MRCLIAASFMMYAFVCKVINRLKKIACDFSSHLGFEEQTSWRGGMGPLWSGNGRQWHSTSGMISCGDAAGLIDPINGEGLTAALLSGRRAGKAVAQYLISACDTRHLQYYSNELFDHFSFNYRNTAKRLAWKYLCG